MPYQWCAGLGGVISAGIADVLATALGEAFITVMTLIYKGEMTTSDFGMKEGESGIREIFEEELSLTRK